MYSYEKEKPAVFTDQGQREFLKVRDFVHRALEFSGAVVAGKALEKAHGMGDSWSSMALVDRLVELGELREITDPKKVVWQNRVFVRS